MRQRKKILLMALFCLVLTITLPMTSALQISRSINPARDVGEDYAVIEWETDETAFTHVQYGTDKDELTTAKDNNRTKFHTLRLENLVPRTKYYYAIVSGSNTSFAIDDNGGNLFSFTTTRGSDTTAPRVGNITVQDLTQSSTTITWLADEPSTGIIHYGIGDYSQVEESTTLTTRHALTIPTTQGETYQFRVESCDQANNCRTEEGPGFLAGRPQESGVTLNVSRYVRAQRISIPGKTIPFATVRLTINGRQYPQVKADLRGDFTFRNVLLPGEDNDVSVYAISQQGDETSPVSATVTVDDTPPRVVFGDIPSIVASSQYALNVNSTEPVTITYTIESKEDEIAPGRVLGVRVDEVTENSVKLSWDNLTETDLLEYAVYRDGQRIAIVQRSAQPSYTDTSVASDTRYTYRISAVDRSCNEGALSSEQAVQTKDGDAQAEEVSTPQFSCAVQERTQEIQASGQISLELGAGRNTIKLRASDPADNAVTKTYETQVDPTELQFVTTNIAQLSPSYSPLVKIRGQVNKKASVLLFVGNESSPSETVLTDDQGYFSIDARLRRDIEIRASGQGASADVTSGWENQIRLRAVDAVGRRVETEGTINYLICGQGAKFSVDIGQVLPDKLTPRLILQGIQQAGFPINVTYRGTNDGKINSISVRPLPLSPSAEEDYDHGWITLRNPDLRRQRGRASALGYVQMQFNKVDLVEEEDATLADKEKALSRHRESECNPGVGCVKLLLEVEVKGTETVQRVQPGPPTPDNQRSSANTEQITQKTCVDVNLFIDQSIHLSEYIPNKLVQSVSDILDKVIEGFDKVLEPLTTVGQYALYSCLAMQGALYLVVLNEQWECKFSGLAKNPTLTGAVQAALGGTNPVEQVASAGLCEHVFGKENVESTVAGGIERAAAASQGDAGAVVDISQPDPTQNPALEQCRGCQEAKEWRQFFEQEIMRPVCDRVACPSAPTLQKYIENAPKPTEILQTPPKPAAGQSLTTGTAIAALEKNKLPNNIQGKIYIGNSCGFIKKQIPRPKTQEERAREVRGATDLRRRAEENQKFIGTFYSTGNTPSGNKPDSPGKDVDGGKTDTNTPKTRGIKEVHWDYLAHKDDEGDTFETRSGTPGEGEEALETSPNIDCGGIGPANPACCGVEYMNEWGSACGIPALALETFNEIDESACLAAQNANKKTDIEGQLEGGLLGGKCDSLFNAAAGFCEPNSGGPTADLVRTGVTYATEQAGLETQDIYIFLMPRLDSDAEVQDYRVRLGGIAKQYEFQQAVNNGQRSGNPTAQLTRPDRQGLTSTDYINADLKAVVRQNSRDITDTFSEQNQIKVRENQAGKRQVITAFKNEICAERTGTSVPTPGAGILGVDGVDVPPRADDTAPRLPGADSPGTAVAAVADLTGWITGAPTAACPLTDTQAEQLYTDVINRIGRSDQEFIVRPDRDGVLRSIQCVCLPALTGYIKWWRNVLNAVNTCLKSVAKTGDASAGTCQAILSTYACDLLYDAVTCFTQKYGSPGSGGRKSAGITGIGDFVGALSNTGTEVSRSVEGRYGDTALWKTMFSERKILHSICGFAFTGTWDLDSQGLFDQVVDDIPLQTEGLIATADRRFISYDPTSSPRGLTSWLYHFSVALNPGTSVRYRVDLVCSDNARCQPQDGFVNGRCDCYGKGEKTLPVSTAELGDGNLDKLELLDTEVFFTAQAGNAGSNYRYDTVRLTWEGTDPNTNEATTGKVEQRIGLTGGQPPAFCSFSTFAGAFLCSIGGEDYTGARFSVSPTPIFPQGQDAYKLNDEIKFNMRVLTNFGQQSQDCVNLCSYSKFLVYEITNQNNQVVKTNNAKKLTGTDLANRDEIIINTNGETPHTIPRISVQVAESMFASSTSELDLKSQATYAPESVRAKVQRIFVQPGTSLTDGQRVRFLVKMTSPTDYTIHTADTFQLRSGITGSGGIADTVTPPYYSQNTNEQQAGSGTMSNNQIRATIGSATIVIQTNGNLQQGNEILFDYTPSRASTSCTRYQDTPAPWKAKFALYDSKETQFGGYEPDYNTITRDPVSEDPQEVTVNFNVYCKDTIEGSRADELNRCSPTQQGTNCFCGNEAQATAAARLIGTAQESTINNCGISINQRGYCGYDWKEDGTNNIADPARVCQAQPSPAVSVTVGGQQLTPGGTLNLAPSPQSRTSTGAHRFEIAATGDQVEIVKVYQESIEIQNGSDNKYYIEIQEQQSTRPTIVVKKQGTQLYNIVQGTITVTSQQAVTLDQLKTFFGQLFAQVPGFYAAGQASQTVPNQGATDHFVQSSLLGVASQLLANQRIGISEVTQLASQANLQELLGESDANIKRYGGTILSIFMNKALENGGSMTLPHNSQLAALDALGYSLTSGTLTLGTQGQSVQWGKSIGQQLQGGTIIVHGNVGEGAGDNMKSGTLTINGNAPGDVAAFIKAGTVNVTGTCGALPESSSDFFSDRASTDMVSISCGTCPDQANLQRQICVRDLGQNVQISCGGTQFYPCAAATPQSQTYNGKTYYKVDSADPRLDSGAEVCQAAGKVCVGYTEPSDAVCKLFHPQARSSTTAQGDRSGVYCNGAPQQVPCANEQNTCHTCPRCTAGVTCSQTIGTLYREMYVECAAPPTSLAPVVDSYLSNSAVATDTWTVAQSAARGITYPSLDTFKTAMATELTRISGLPSSDIKRQNFEWLGYLASAILYNIPNLPEEIVIDWPQNPQLSGLGTRMNLDKTLRIRGGAKDFVGSAMTLGTVIVEGNAGNNVGGGMSCGTDFQGVRSYLGTCEIRINGNAGDQLGYNMRGGVIKVSGRISGSVGPDMTRGIILSANSCTFAATQNTPNIMIYCGGTFYPNGARPGRWFRAGSNWQEVVAPASWDRPRIRFIDIINHRYQDVTQATIPWDGRWETPNNNPIIDTNELNYDSSTEFRRFFYTYGGGWKGASGSEGDTRRTFSGFISQTANGGWLSYFSGSTPNLQTSDNRLKPIARVLNEGLEHSCVGGLFLIRQTIKNDGAGELTYRDSRTTHDEIRIRDALALDPPLYLEPNHYCPNS